MKQTLINDVVQGMLPFLDNGQIAVTTHDNANFFHRKTSMLNQKGRTETSLFQCAQTVGYWSFLCSSVVLHKIPSVAKNDFKKLLLNCITREKSCQGKTRHFFDLDLFFLQV